MKLNPILQKIHNYVTDKMSKSYIVENLLIAKVTLDDGTEYDCIYCTILRNVVIFTCIGFVFGLLIGWSL